MSSVLLISIHVPLPRASALLPRTHCRRHSTLYIQEVHISRSPNSAHSLTQRHEPQPYNYAVQVQVDQTLASDTSATAFSHPPFRTTKALLEQNPPDMESAIRKCGAGDTASVAQWRPIRKPVACRSKRVAQQLESSTLEERRLPRIEEEDDVLMPDVDDQDDSADRTTADSPLHLDQQHEASDDSDAHEYSAPSRRRTTQPKSTVGTTNAYEKRIRNLQLQKRILKQRLEEQTATRELVPLSEERAKFRKFRKGHDEYCKDAVLDGFKEAWMAKGYDEEEAGRKAEEKVEEKYEGVFGEGIIGE